MNNHEPFKVMEPNIDRRLDESVYGIGVLLDFSVKEWEKEELSKKDDAIYHTLKKLRENLAQKINDMKLSKYSIDPESIPESITEVSNAWWFNKSKDDDASCMIKANVGLVDSEPMDALVKGFIGYKFAPDLAAKATSMKKMLYNFDLVEEFYLADIASKSRGNWYMGGYNPRTKPRKTFLSRKDKIDYGKHEGEIYEGEAKVDLRGNAFMRAISKWRSGLIDRLVGISKAEHYLDDYVDSIKDYYIDPDSFGFELSQERTEKGKKEYVLHGYAKLKKGDLAGEVISGLRKLRGEKFGKKLDEQTKGRALRTLFLNSRLLDRYLFEEIKAQKKYAEMIRTAYPLFKNECYRLRLLIKGKKEEKELDKFLEEFDNNVSWIWQKDKGSPNVCMLVYSMAEELRKHRLPYFSVIKRLYAKFAEKTVPEDVEFIYEDRESGKTEKISMKREEYLADLQNHIKEQISKYIGNYLTAPGDRIGPDHTFMFNHNICKSPEIKDCADAVRQRIRFLMNLPIYKESSYLQNSKDRFNAKLDELVNKDDVRGAQAYEKKLVDGIKEICYAADRLPHAVKASGLNVNDFAILYVAPALDEYELLSEVKRELRAIEEKRKAADDKNKTADKYSNEMAA